MAKKDVQVTPEERLPEVYEEDVYENDRSDHEKALGYLGDLISLEEGNASFEIESDGSGSDINVWSADSESPVTLNLTHDETWELADVLRRHVDHIRRNRSGR